MAEEQRAAPFFLPDTGDENVTADLDDVYKRVPLEELPWDSDEPPAMLADAVRAGRVKPPCRCLDIGCGSGKYALWMCAQGFDVVGVDSSRTALGIAERLAAERGLSGKLRLVAEDPSTAKGRAATLALGPFAFAYDWLVLHCVPPAGRPGYADTVAAALAPGGLYLTVSFAVQQRPEGQSVPRVEPVVTPLGNRIYLSGEEELRALMEPRFEVLSLETVTTCALARRGDHTHRLVVCWCRKR
eukprot:TRINITY_DN17281_c0_g1_i1.p1 TRINITY_DN17281_c0_g1~~TRINITY_DN17281_c0_g1_i1.p1  ORF type:complete len:253 (+),score=53.56 TRINITY_DN17281_c0_g1_i1:31-759(+)